MAKTNQKYKKPLPRKTVAQSKKTERKNQDKFRYKKLIIIASILIITYISVSPSLKNGFTNWDDNVYVTENNLIMHLKAENIKIMFFDFLNCNYYHPLTFLSLAIDYNSVKLNPARYHLVNVLFHILNTLLVFIFIYRLSGKKVTVAAIVAIVFGIHPMHVESVAWITERKDVLYAFFFIGALITYLSYLRKEARSFLFYFFTLVLFILSVLSKPSAIIFPVILLLIDFFMKRKFDIKCLLEKTPFFIISIIFGIITIKDQSNVAITEWSAIAIHHRLIFASYGFITYIYKLFIPFNLSAFYPYPTKFPITEALPAIFYAAPFIALGLFFLVYKSLKISRLYAFGFLFFFFNIIMVLQFLSVGPALMAERYTYMSYIGLAFIGGMEFDRLYNSKKVFANAIKYFVTGLLIIYGIMFASLTYQRTQVWKNSNTLWTDVIKKFPLKVEVAYKNRGNYFAREANQYDKALQDFNTFISISPYDATILNNRGNLYVLMQKPELSIADYTKAISIDPTYYDSYINRGITYANIGKYDLALADMDKAIKLNPGKNDVYKNRAFCYSSMGKYEEAIKDYNLLITKEPESVGNYLNRGIAFFNSKRYNEAIADFSMTIQLDTANKVAYCNRSQAYNLIGDYKNALSDALKAQQMGQAINEEYINVLKSKKQ